MSVFFLKRKKIISVVAILIVIIFYNLIMYLNPKISILRYVSPEGMKDFKDDNFGYIISFPKNWDVTNQGFGDYGPYTVISNNPALKGQGYTTGPEDIEMKIYAEVTNSEYIEGVDYINMFTKPDGYSEKWLYEKTSSGDLQARAEITDFYHLKIDSAEAIKFDVTPTEYGKNQTDLPDSQYLSVYVTKRENNKLSLISFLTNNQSAFQRNRELYKKIANSLKYKSPKWNLFFTLNLNVSSLNLGDRLTIQRMVFGKIAIPYMHISINNEKNLTLNLLRGSYEITGDFNKSDRHAPPMKIYLNKNLNLIYSVYGLH